MTVKKSKKPRVKQIPPNELQIALAGVKAIHDAMVPYLVTLGTDEKRALPKMGGKSIDFVSKSFNYATVNPEFKPGFIDVDDYSNNVGAFTGVRSLYQPLSQLLDMLDDTMALAGSEALESSLAYYQSIKTAAKLKLPGAATIAEDLAARFAGQGPKSTSGTPSGT